MIASPNFTQIPNDFFDTIMRTLSPTENMVFMAIMRKTFGWQKKRDKISYTQIAEMTGIGSYSTIKKALATLEERGLILSEKIGKSIAYEVNVDTSTENVEDEKTNDYRLCSDTITKTVEMKPKTTTDSVDTKEREYKETNKINYSIIEDAYFTNFKALYTQGRVAGEKPIIDASWYPKVRKRVKAVAAIVPEEKIVHAINAAMSDDWIVSQGYSLLTILADTQLNKLINGKSQPAKTGMTRQRTTMLDMREA